MVSEYLVGKWEREEEAERFICWGERWISRVEDSEEPADVDGLLATRGHGDVWVYGPGTAMVACVFVCGPCYHL